MCSGEEDSNGGCGESVPSWTPSSSSASQPQPTDEQAHGRDADANHGDDGGTTGQRPPASRPDVPRYLQHIKYCSRCASAMSFRVPVDDTRVRAVCDKCQWTNFLNPKVVTGSVATTPDKQRVLLCKRAIPPSVGKWTLPAGFHEMDESTEQGAAREALEEACARIQVGGLLAVFNVLPAMQVQLLYRSVLLAEEEIAAGVESLDVRLFRWNEIPWAELAFPTVEWALVYARETLDVADALLVPQMRTKPFPVDAAAAASAGGGAASSGTVRECRQDAESAQGGVAGASQSQSQPQRSSRSSHGDEQQTL